MIPSDIAQNIVNGNRRDAARALHAARKVTVLHTIECLIDSYRWDPRRAIDEVFVLLKRHGK